MHHVDRKQHWEEIYATKSPTEVSWYQTRPAMSLELIRKTDLGSKANLIDIGGGVSSLVDYLLDDGYRHVTVLDISAKALQRAKERLGSRSQQVTWIEADITQADPPAAAYDVWHDRAVFHFLTEPQDRKRYLAVLERSLKIGGYVIMATFASDGPSRCSGLIVERYSVETLARELGNRYRLLESLEETHKTPFNTEQKFVYGFFQKT